MKNPSKIIWDRIAYLEGTAESGKVIEDVVREIFNEMGATSASYNYPLPEGPFQGHICVSINDEVCHGVPNTKKIDWDRDVVNVDISFELDEVYYDTCKSWGKQQISKDSKVITESIVEYIKRAYPTTREIGAYTEKTIKKMGYETVPQFVGHGIGTELHMAPMIPAIPEHGHDIYPFHYTESFTVEPIITDGKVYAQTEIQLFRDGEDYVGI